MLRVSKPLAIMDNSEVFESFIHLQPLPSASFRFRGLLLQNELGNKRYIYLRGSLLDIMTVLISPSKKVDETLASNQTDEGTADNRPKFDTLKDRLP